MSGEYGYSHHSSDSLNVGVSILELPSEDLFDFVLIGRGGRDADEKEGGEEEK